MPTRDQVMGLLGEGHTYETAGRQLHVSPGQAFMIATGVAADGSDSVPPGELEQRPVLSGSSQHLVNPPPFNPTRDDRILAWVKERARRELTQDPGSR